MLLTRGNDYVDFVTMRRPTWIVPKLFWGPGTSLWGTNAVSGVIDVTTKSAQSTQGNSVRLAIESMGTFLGEFVYGAKVGDDEFYRVWVRDHRKASLVEKNI